MNLKVNCCDGIYNSFDVHFTSTCDNKCAHCIDHKYAGTGIVRPDADKIADKIVFNQTGFDDVLFLGGEPCLFLDELIACITKIKKYSDLKIYVTTSIPATCYDEKEKFYHLIELLDGLNLSVQHFDENIADMIRRTKSTYDRQKFYSELPHKEKIRINLNIVKPFLYTKEDLTKVLRHYDEMGFNSIKLSEIQHGKDQFVSFEKTFDIKLGSPFSSGCQKYLDMESILPGFKTSVLLKRSCFMCEETLRASLKDAYKAFRLMCSFPKNKYAVIYEDGSMQKGWV